MPGSTEAVRSSKLSYRHRESKAVLLSRKATSALTYYVVSPVSQLNPKGIFVTVMTGSSYKAMPSTPNVMILKTKLFFIQWAQQGQAPARTPSDTK